MTTREGISNEGEKIGLLENPVADSVFLSVMMLEKYSSRCRVNLERVEEIMPHYCYKKHLKISPQEGVYEKKRIHPGRNLWQAAKCKKSKLPGGAYYCRGWTNSACTRWRSTSKEYNSVNTKVGASL